MAPALSLGFFHPLSMYLSVSHPEYSGHVFNSDLSLVWKLAGLTMPE